MASEVPRGAQLGGRRREAGAVPHCGILGDLLGSRGCSAPTCRADSVRTPEGLLGPHCGPLLRLSTENRLEKGEGYPCRTPTGGRRGGRTAGGPASPPSAACRDRTRVPGTG